MNKMTLAKVDLALLREFGDFLPPKVFDIHAHVCRREDCKNHWRMLAGGRSALTAHNWRKATQPLLRRSQLIGGLLIPIPTSPENCDDANGFLTEQLRTEPNCRGLMLVSPAMKAAAAEKALANGNIRGFKPYHLLIDGKARYDAPLARFLPEWVWRLAHDGELVITLHMVRTLALSDPGNLKTIAAMCARYPKARLVLAHAARGFHPGHTIKGIRSIAHLRNVWFDSSGICESPALEAILREFGPTRLLWGSDYPISCIRAKCVSVGDSFLWLNTLKIDWRKVTPACHPTLVGVESLLALRQACDSIGLNSDDRCQIFCDNAMELLGAVQPSTDLTQKLYRHARERIPGGVNLLSKRPEQFAPNQWPAYFREARGCEMWDLDGRHYYDMSLNGIMACILGFRDPDVNRAVKRRIDLGSWCTQNPADEVAVADLLCEIHPWAERVRFARTGGECAGVGVRIARATTDRSLVAICGYHGWQDWYLAANLGDNNALRGHLLPGLDPLGVPIELRGSSLPFKYNDRQAFQAILDQHGSRLAAVIMEPCRYTDPEPGFLEFVRDGIHKAGGLLIFDEITIGWRLILGGAHRRFGVNPDLALFAKTIANGYPMAAIIGTKEAMEGAHKSFISSAFWTESIGPAAALATIKKLQRIDAPAHVAKMGQLVIDAWRKSAERHNAPLVVEDGYPALPHCHFDHPQANELKTLYTQLMLERGFLGGVLFVPTMAHNETIIARYATAIDEVLSLIKDAIDKERITETMKGPQAHVGFRRLL